MARAPYRIGLDGGLACSKRPTGVEFFARSLLRELLRLPVDEAEWYLYLPPAGDPGSPVPERVRTRYRPDFNTMLNRPWLAARTWSDRLDVFHAFGHLFTPGCRGRCVLTVHDLVFDDYPECYAAGAPERARREVRAACARSVRMVVPSRSTAAGLVRTYGYPERRIDIIYEGSRPEFQPGEAGPVPERVRNAGVEPPFLLCVGRLDRRKNLERVVDAYRRLLREKVPCGGLVVAGPDDSGSPEVRRRVADGRVEGERIAVTGYLSDAELLGLYRGAAVLVYPSLAEGFGLPVLEAMACGTPVITSSVSSMPEVAGEAALLVDPLDAEAIASALRRVLTEPGLRERLAVAGRERAGLFSWRRSAELLAESLLRAARGDAS